ncbi:MAG: hypothetical protein GF331_09360 [Chitinivibrionales bacterium]|nr:hypothetical protein [Chitinivibrionales bacterium]
MKYVVALSLATLMVFSSCSKKNNVEHVQLLDENLTFTLDISPDREKPDRINGKLKVVNSSIDLVKYGNFQLFLEAADMRAETHVKTSQATAMADHKLLHLSPGDTLHFFAHWDYDDNINFDKSDFELVYDPTIKAPEEAGDLVTKRDNADVP